MRVAALLLVALLAAGCTKPDGPADDRPIFVQSTGGAQSGGLVTDTPATFSNFTISPSTVPNDGTGSSTIAVTVTDANAETDISSITLSVNASGYTFTHSVTAAERLATTEPASYGSDSWKVWTGTLNDGTLYAKYFVSVPSGTTAGTYVFGVRATNPTNVVSYPVPAAQVSLVVRAPTVVTVASAPVSATGVAQTGVTWGQWSANPGDANVAGANYLKLTNTGAYPTPSVVIDFSGTSFVGATDANYTVPIDGNVQYAWWEDTTGTAKPNAGTYTWRPTSTDGSLTVSFTGQNRVIYVIYRVVAVPSVLPVQTYASTFTATDI